MPIRHEGSLLKNGITCFLRSRCTRAELPFSSTPCTWKTLFARSSPIVMILIADAPFLVLSPSPIRMIVDGWCRGVHIINGEQGRFFMAAAIGLRIDYTADELRRLAKASRDAKQTRRLLALAAIYDGGSRTDAARIGGVGLQVVRDWVLRFNSSGPSGLIDRKAPGKAALLTAEHRSALAE